MSGSSKTIQSVPKLSSLQSLNFDCLRIILDNLSVEDLTSLGKTNVFFSRLVENELIFEQRFSKKMVVFASMPGIPEIPDDIIETGDSIIISHPLIAAEMLENFGSRMRNIKIFSESYYTENNSILFSEHCSKSLEQLHLNDIRPAIGKYILEPFQRVTNLSIDGFALDLSNEQYDFNEMFPLLQRLYLGDSSLFFLRNLKSLILNFPHLKHLHAEIHDMELLDNYYPIDEDVINEFIYKNSQIQSLSLSVSCLTTHLLKYVVKKLPDLEKLELHHLFTINENVLFENVRSLKSGNHKYPFKLPECIRFTDKLEEFEAVMKPGDNEGFDFIENHKSLKTIRITTSKGFTNNDVLRLTYIKLNAIFLSMNVKNDIKHDTIIQFIEKNEQLNELHLKFEIKNEKKSFLKSITQFCKKTFFDVSILREKIENNWNIYENGKDIVIIKI